MAAAMGGAPTPAATASGHAAGHPNHGVTGATATGSTATTGSAAATSSAAGPDRAPQVTLASGQSSLVSTPLTVSVAVLGMVFLMTGLMLWRRRRAATAGPHTR